MGISKTGILNSCHQDVNREQNRQNEVDTFPIWYKEAAKRAMEGYAQKKVSEYLQKVKSKINEKLGIMHYNDTVLLGEINEYVDELTNEYKFVENGK